MKNSKSVSIIIVNWNQKAVLSNCLQSLKTKTAYENFDVVVVDNGSVDGSAQLVKNNFPWASLIALDQNYGFSIGNNKGIKYALQKHNPDYVLLLNNDTEIVQADWLTQLVSVAQTTPDIGIVGSKLIYPNKKTQYIGTKITVKGLSWLNTSTEDQFPKVFELDSVLGACFLIKREVINTIGLLDEGFSPFVHEETDYCVRAKKANYKTVMVLTTTVVHHWKLSVNKRPSPYVEYIVRRNLIRFMLLNFPALWLLKRAPVEMRLFYGSFITRNSGPKRLLPIKLRTGEDLLVKLHVNWGGWVYNFRHLQEIFSKRKNRTAKLVF